jgi:hypothetical protein
MSASTVAPALLGREASRHLAEHRYLPGGHVGFDARVRTDGQMMVADFDAALDPAINGHVLRADEIAPKHHRLADPGDNAPLFALKRARGTR